MPSPIGLARTELRGRLLTMAGGPYTVLAENWDGSPPTPESTTIWLYERLRPTDSRVVGMGSTMLVRTSGVWLLDIHVAANTGSSAADVMIERVLTHFGPWLVLGSAPDLVRITRTFVGQGRAGAQWYQIPCEIEWQADTVRAP